MGLFDDLKRARANEKEQGIQSKTGNKTENISFAKFPDDLDEFKTLPQAQLSTSFDKETTH